MIDPKTDIISSNGFRFRVNIKTTDEVEQYIKDHWTTVALPMNEFTDSGFRYRIIFWIDEHATGKWTRLRNTFYFEKEVDSTLFILTHL
jgi:hypothetical protein